MEKEQKTSKEVKDRLIYYSAFKDYSRSSNCIGANERMIANPEAVVA
jgi:hypothetical protein